MFKNLTQHKIVIQKPDGDRVEINPSGIVTRVSSKAEMLEVLDGIPLSRIVYGEVQDLPAPEYGVVFIVSGLVLGRVQNRLDLFAPDSGPTAIRENGNIVAVCGLVRG